MHVYLLNTSSMILSCRQVARNVIRITILHLYAAQKLPRSRYRGWWGCWLLAGCVLAYADPVPADAPPDLYRNAMLAMAEGRLAAAEKALTLLAASEEPRQAGAWLDLAMLYCAAGEAGAAENLFTQIERRFAPPPLILEVIAWQRKLGCAGWQTKNDVTLRLGRGFESNVNQGAHQPSLTIGSGEGQIDLVLLPGYRPLSDQFTSLSAEWVGDFSSNGASGMLQLQSQIYDHLGRYSTNSLLAGAELPWRWGGWGFRGLGSTGVTTLDGQQYLRQRQLQLEVAPPLPLPANWQFGVTGSWSAIAYPTLNSFDAQWWETRATLRYRRDGLWWQASASALQDRPVGERPGGDRAGTFADFQGRMSLASNVVGEVGWKLQRWQGERAYFPGLIEVPRLQQARVLRAAAVFQLSPQQAFVLELKETNNYENVSVFDYRNRVLQLHWRWQALKNR